jgi:hypothetical protein
MKNNFNKITKMFLAIGTIAMLFGCSKTFLDQKPFNSVVISEAIKTEDDMSTALTGLYSSLRATDFYGRTFAIKGDLMADKCFLSSSNSGRYVSFNLYNFTKTDGYASAIWSNGYNAIKNANFIINAGLDPASNPNVSQLMSEAYAIRGLVYFDLVRNFGLPYTTAPSSAGVPIVTKFEVSSKPARNTVAEVYAQVIADLTKAISLAKFNQGQTMNFTLTAKTRSLNSSFMTKYAAETVLARVYQHKGDWANAKAAALDVIANSGFSLVTSSNVISYWKGAAPLTGKVETMFELSFDAVANNAFDALAYIYLQTGNYGDMLCSTELYGKFDAADVRKAMYATGTRGGLASVFVNKFTSFSGDHTDTKVVRFSEMYLIAAEASYPSNAADALKYVNEVTSRRGAPAIASSGANLLEDIILERRKELAFEGERYPDMQRLKRGIVRSTDYPSSARTIDYTNFRRLMPIPQGELDANATIKTQQNPGWT